MYGCPINEAWGDDFQKKKKKKKNQNPPISPQEKDNELLIPEKETKSFNQESALYQQLQGLQINPSNAIDNFYESIPSKSYERQSTVQSQLETPLRSISEEEWNEYLDFKRWKKTGETVLTKPVVESMSVKQPRTNHLTTQEEQFNELLLYMFTGFILLMLYDNIYKLGKKSY